MGHGKECLLSGSSQVFHIHVQVYLKVVVFFLRCHVRPAEGFLSVYMYIVKKTFVGGRHLAALLFNVCGKWDWFESKTVVKRKQAGQHNYWSWIDERRCG